MSTPKPARTPLPPGTVIEYMGEEATVLEDNGADSLIVECYGDRQKWRWTFEDVSCTVVSMPIGIGGSQLMTSRMEVKP